METKEEIKKKIAERIEQISADLANAQSVGPFAFERYLTLANAGIEMLKQLITLL